MKRALMTGAILLLLQGHASAAIIASLVGDFSSPTLPSGWQYLRNTGPIGTSAGYVPLLWDGSLAWYDVTPGIMPANPPAWGDYTLLNATAAHPGPGVAQGETQDRYLVLAYTIQPGEEGAIELVNGSLVGRDPAGEFFSNGWDVRTFVGDSEVGTALLFDWSSSPSAFGRSLGNLNAGETVYLALGPRGSHLYDSAALDFTLTSTPVPEPASAALAIGIAAVLGARRRSKGSQV